jgi:chloramphenicol O-acetyltransferase type B
MTTPGVDKLIVGSFCSIGSGAAFIMAGNQGHRYDWVSSFPFHYMPEIPGFGTAADAFAPAGDTVIGNDVWIGTEAIIMPGITIGHGASSAQGRSSPRTSSPTPLSVAIRPR